MTDIDNDVMRALKCCAIGMDCEHCPNKDVGIGCVSLTLNNSLDLINRMHEDYNRLQKAYVKELVSAKAEIEQKRKFLSDSLEEIKGLKLKVQIQEQEIKKLQNYGIRADWKEHCRKLITEAVKEFAERLKEKAFYCERTDGKSNFMVAEMEIDNLLKEMEKNDE